MAWVWDVPKERESWGADIDYEASAPMLGLEHLAESHVDSKLTPVFRSSAGLQRFKRFHCPPIWVSPTVDRLWSEIILKFVPKKRVQFLPVRLIARGEVCDDFMWVIPFDRVRCIDPEKSLLTDVQALADITLIFGASKIVHKPNCLNGIHLARDPQMPSHMLVSDELVEALSATGESSMFRRIENL